MGFLDNLKSSLTETSQDLTKKAKDTTEIFRLTNLNKANEKEIEKAIYQVGLNYYSKYKDECEVKFPELFLRIQKLQEEITENKEIIEKLSIEEVCPNCGKKLSSGARFCIYCGNAIEKDTILVRMSEETCSSCGTPLENGAAFCTNCGAPIQKIEKEVTEEEFDRIFKEKMKDVKKDIDINDYVEGEEEVLLEVWMSDSAQRKEVKRCINCGKEVGEQDIFCMNCGTSIEN